MSSSKQLTAKIRFNTTDAEKKIDSLVKKINGIDNALRKVSGSNNVEHQLKKSNIQAKGIVNQVRMWLKIQRQITSSTSATNGILGTIGSKLKMLGTTYLGILGAKGAANASDTITSARNKLNNLEGGSPEATTEAMDKMYVAAQKSRSGYSDMLNNVSKTMTLAGDAFDNNIDNAIRFQEIMAKAYSVGGASAAEQSSSMYQLVQALGSGILQGDELRSVREGAPIAYKEIEKFAQGVLKTEDSLKDLASQGKITSDMVIAAIMNAGDEIEAKFDKTKMTFAQAWTMIKNMALQAFRPVLDMLNETLNSDLGQKILNGIGQTFVWLANTLLTLADVIGNVFSWIADNWYWLQYVVTFAITVILSYYGYLAVLAVMAGIQWMILNWKMLLTLVVIGLLVTGIIWLANTVKTGVDFMVGCFLFLALTVGIVALILGSAVLGWVAVAILAIDVLVAVIAVYGEEIGRIVGYVVAFLYNLVVGFINQAIQQFWYLIDPIASIVEWIYNAFNGGFNGIGGACANLVGQICSWFLSLGKVVTTIIDAIFGTDWTSGLKSLQDEVLEWGKNEEALSIDRNVTVSDIGKKIGVDIPNRISYEDAGIKGAEIGAAAQVKLESLGSTMKNGITNFDLSKLAGTGDMYTGIGEAPGSYLPGLNDPAYNLNLTPTNDYLSDINDNVGDIKDDMDLSNDDLEYLRKIADMEWRNEFTTAEIKVDMTNNNTVSGERDLDGIVEYLSDVLRSELTNVAYGVHY